MNKTLRILSTTALFLTLTVGCAKKTIVSNATTQTEENETIHSVATENQISPADINRFRVTQPEQVGNVEVVCRNCHAHFKLSHKIKKMSMKGDAVIDCPVCHHDYLGKH